MPALLVFAILAWWVNPAVTVRDAGEFATAAYHLGVAHETGFPLYLLMGKVATLLPLGEIAFRIGLVSLATTVGGAWLLGRVLARSLGDGTAARASGTWVAVTLPSAALIFRWAIAPEVYGPTLLAAATALWLVLAAWRGDEVAGRRLGLVLGLCFGLHAELRLVIGLPCLAASLFALRRGARWPLVLGAAGGLGLAVLAAIPLRAAADSFVNWSDPRTLAGTVAHLTAARIRAAFSDEMLRFDRDTIVAAARLLASQLEDSLGLLPMMAAAGGAIAGLRRSETRALASLALYWIVADIAYGLVINPMGLRDWQVGQVAVAGALMLAGIAWFALAERFGRAAPFAIVVLAIVAAAEPIARRGDLKALPHPALDRVVAAALDAEPRALLLVTSDDLAGGLLYAQGILGRRPDVTVLVRQQLFDAPSVAQRIRRGGNEVRRFGDKLTAKERIARQAELAERMIGLELSRRQILWEAAQDPPPTGQLVPAWPLFALLPLGPTAAPFDVATLAPLARKNEQAFAGVADPLTRTLPAAFVSQLGRLALAGHHQDAARRLFDAALRWVPDDAATGTNLAVLDAMAGDYAAAAERAEAILRRDPSRFVARMNAGKYRLQLGSRAIADAHFAAAARLRPRDPSPAIWRTRVAIADKERDRALQHLDTATRLAPNDLDVKRAQGEFRALWPE